MPLTNFIIKPGINKEVTEYTGQGQWIDSDYVRFFQGLPQKIKGWEKFVATTIVGVARDQHAWVALDGRQYDALGTDRKLYLYSEGNIHDITPIRATEALTDPFTTNGTSTVVVTDASHDAQEGDFVTFDSFSTIDGLDMNKEFEIQTVVNSSAYTVQHTSTASGSSTGGGTGNAAYQINVGPGFSVAAYGWGTGAWNEPREAALAPDNGWGTPTDNSEVTLEARQWSLNNYGEDLIATVLNGGTFIWDASNGVTTRAIAVANAPTASRLSITTTDRHLVCFGTETDIGNVSSKDDLFLAWSDQENINDWTPTAINTAGSLRINDGSRIIAAERSRGQSLVWTDTSLHSLQYIGPPYTFGVRQLGQNCGIVGIHAAVDLNGVSYWMSQDSFYMFDGSVKKLPCTVEQYVFSNLNISAAENVFCGHNSEFNEVLWFYAKADSNQINAVVAYNYLENTWWTGSLSRSTWMDRDVYENPIATYYLANTVANNNVILGLTAGASQLYIQEQGNNADGAAINAYLKSGAVSLNTGDEFAFVSKFIPDIKNQSGTLKLKLEFKRYPNDSTPVTKNLEFTSTTNKKDLRGRGRQFIANVYSDTTNTAWRLGTLRFDIQPDGRR